MALIVKVVIQLAICLLSYLIAMKVGFKLLDLIGRRLYTRVGWILARVVILLLIAVLLATIALVNHFHLDASFVFVCGIGILCGFINGLDNFLSNNTIVVEKKSKAEAYDTIRLEAGEVAVEAIEYNEDEKVAQRLTF